MDNHQREINRVKDVISEAERFLHKAKEHLKKLQDPAECHYSMTSRSAMKRSGLDLKVAISQNNKSKWE